MNRTAIIAISAVVIILVIALFSKVVLFPKQIQGDVLRVRLLSVTPSETGETGMFELLNENGPKVDIFSASVFQSNGSSEVPVEQITLDKGDKATVEISAPGDERWRVSFRVHRHPKETWRHGTLVDSEWIDSQTDVTTDASL